MLNIGGDASDRSYRYKMPPMTTKIEGRGNGIRTVLTNMVEVAKALHVDPAYPTKYFGIELGAQSKFKAETEKASVNGQHQTGDLQQILTKFISQFILCPTCGLPEISRKIKSSGIKIDCAACGHNSVLKTGHRLETYMVKHHKQNKKGRRDKEGKKKERRRDRRNKDAKEDKSQEATTTPDSSSEPVVWYTDTSEEAREARKAAEFQTIGGEADVNEKLEQILAEAGDSKSPVTALRIFLAERERTVAEIIGEVRVLQLARGLEDAQRVKMLLEALIDVSDVKTVASQFAEDKNAELFKHYADDKNSAMIFIGCLEELCGVVEPKLLPRVPIILQKLYEKEVLTEEVLIAWYDSPPESSWLVNKDVATLVRNKARPLIDWLRDSDDDEDEDEDEDEE